MKRADEKIREVYSYEVIFKANRSKALERNRQGLGWRKGRKDYCIS